MLSEKLLIAEALSLEYHDSLNPLIFDRNGQVHQSVRDHLLAIAEAWRDFANIPQDVIDDIILVGGNANYNYTQMSDLDVHLMVDKDKMGIKRSFLDDYWSDKKALWANKHHITVKGYNVELYAQDKNEKLPEGQGMYSLKDNKWLKEPQNLHLDFSKDPELLTQADYYESLIRQLIRVGNVNQLIALRKQFRDMRTIGLQKGEFGHENLLFKELRNRGIFDKMNNFIVKQYDTGLSEMSDKIHEDAPTNSMGLSSSSSGPIQTFDPLLNRKRHHLLRRMLKTYLKGKAKKHGRTGTGK